MIQKGCKEAGKILVSIAAGVLVVETALSIAKPSSSLTEPPKVVEKKILEKDPVPPPENHPSPPKEEATDPVAHCNTEYYAIFTANGALHCAANPTDYLAKYGPPSPEWFTDSQFSITVSDCLSNDKCLALAKSAKLNETEGFMFNEPLRRGTFEGKSVDLVWACGDYF